MTIQLNHCEAEVPQSTLSASYGGRRASLKTKSALFYAQLQLLSAKKAIEEVNNYTSIYMEESRV